MRATPVLCYCRVYFFSLLNGAENFGIFLSFLCLMPHIIFVMLACGPVGNHQYVLYIGIVSVLFYSFCYLSRLPVASLQIVEIY